MIRFQRTIILAPVVASSFVFVPRSPRLIPIHPQEWHSASNRASTFLLVQPQGGVQLEASLDDEKVKSLFAWISRAIAGESRYDDLMIAMAAIFGNLPEESEPIQMLQNALTKLPVEEDEPIGFPYSVEKRERQSLGALGAGQWTGQTAAFPHSVLLVRNITSLDEWESSLPRTCRQNIRRAHKTETAGNLTVLTRPVLGDESAPHSSLTHFRCVVEHELRLLARDDDPEVFFDALLEAVGRFVDTTRMTGVIREYSCGGRVVAFLHEIRKGKTIRGQWFYATDEGARKFVWFHSIRELVRRAVEREEGVDVDVVDLGPNGSDGCLGEHAELKRSYGFVLVEDWPSVVDYHGPFW
mmetsp:Transcript_46782/g.69202  ORF Transcript_46782/g.69202 Transcript_46782/m.69202 type:complete len:355 (-) Transcript_46782:320-1384(-)|eukprot:CAMPEP_0195521602 /NCGR_PEP_ID=MMETSP0794_2-20130614/19034_1 /TAXON_ID=515487 /ORGANISM="Stephanopyxis turris, Strain CCMP 815" /LENGTH=354 /DNA_ID=CAMNT_0040651187 /DNA_START=82 /DNA_END=1146 /DNA_ORIENTATION=+